MPNVKSLSVMNPVTPSNPHGAGRTPGGANQQRRIMKSLALHIRDRVDFDKVIDRLVTMTEGKDPATGEPITVHDQQAAAKILLERGFGMPAMHVALEGTVRNELVLAAPRPERPTMSIDEINERRAKLRALGIKPKVIDVEETPQLTEGAGIDDE